MFEKPRNEKTTQEQYEQRGESIAEKRGGLFARITKRILQERDEAGSDVLNAGETEKLIMSKLKKVPIVNGVFTSCEGLIGAEYGKPNSPNRKLNTKESMIKYGTGALMILKGALEMSEQEKTGQKPENILSNKTLGWIEETAIKKEEENPDGKSTKALRSVYNFLKENSDLVAHFEDKIS
jgi:hypothetical protein